ncbi:MAG TPA: hypothetical protein VF021_00825 [Longimicrobiales bacterium]
MLALLCCGCSSVLSSYDVAPNGLIRSEYRFRRYLASGHADSALLQIRKSPKKSKLPKDDLLRLLFEGVAAHYAGDFERSAAAFDRASLLADDRSTKSISRAALSVMVNDLSLAYEPSRTERLLLPYYAALTYAQAGDLADAAVEARRLSALLQSLQDHDHAPDKPLGAFLHYFAGSIFEAAGLRVDAAVSYRNAYTLDASVLPKVPPPAGDSAGDVVILVEHGFAPHRVQESLFVMLGVDERKRFEHDRNDDERRTTASQVAARVLAFASGDGPRSGEPRARTLWVPAPTETKASTESKPCEPADSTAKKDKQDCDDDDDEPYLLRMSWPVMYAPARPMPAPVLRVDSTAVAAASQLHIADAVLEDFRAEQPVIVARTVARAAAKYLLTRSAKKSAGKHEALGTVIGAISNIGGALTEQADIRSWHLLPGVITVTRVRLSPGTHTLTLDGNDLGNVHIAAGRVTVLSKRIWQ